jgi:5-carboxymethyl-2-hydroxymuconate isomerase
MAVAVAVRGLLVQAQVAVLAEGALLPTAVMAHREYRVKAYQVKETQAMLDFSHLAHLLDGKAEAEAVRELLA